MDRDGRDARPRPSTRSDLKELVRSRNEKGAGTVDRSDEKVTGGIVNAKTGISPSGNVPSAPERYNINELDIITFKLKKMMLEVEGNGFDAQGFYNRALTLIEANHATLANSTDATLAECRRMSAETLAATTSGYRSVAKAIDDWHADFAGVNDNARRLQDTTRKLVVDLQGCDKRIQRAVAEGIRNGILKGNRIVRAALVTLALNTGVLMVEIAFRLLG
jgi:hypothetical protein